MCSSKKLHDDYLFDDDEDSSENDDDDDDDDDDGDRNIKNGVAAFNHRSFKLKKKPASTNSKLRPQNSLGVASSSCSSAVSESGESEVGEQDEDQENEIEDEKEDNYWTGSLNGETGDFGTQAFIKVIQQQIDEIPSMKRIGSEERESDRMISSLRELPSHTAAKTNFLLGERTPNYFDAMDMDGGIDEIDEIDEINEADDAGEMSRSEAMRNHRRKATANPIYQCDEIRLRFRVDSMNQSDENTTHNEDNDDEVISNVEQLKQNHRTLKMNKRTMSHKSCIDL